MLPQQQDGQVIDPSRRSLRSFTVCSRGRPVIGLETHEDLFRVASLGSDSGCLKNMRWHVGNLSWSPPVSSEIGLAFSAVSTITNHLRARPYLLSKAAQAGRPLLSTLRCTTVSDAVCQATRRGTVTGDSNGHGTSAPDTPDTRMTSQRFSPSVFPQCFIPG